MISEINKMQVVEEIIILTKIQIEKNTKRRINKKILLLNK